jgi:hypothetical protein
MHPYLVPKAYIQIDVYIRPTLELALTLFPLHTFSLHTPIRHRRIPRQRPSTKMSTRPLSQTPDRQDADYVIHKTLRRLRLGVSQGPYKTREQILHQLRGIKEKTHRRSLIETFSREPLRWRLASGEQNQVRWACSETIYSKSWALQHIIQCHNKSTAIYLFDPRRQGSHLLNGTWKFVDAGSTASGSSHTSLTSNTAAISPKACQWRGTQTR